MSVGSRVRLTDLQTTALNGSFGVVVSIEGERLGVELEANSCRIAVRPQNLEATSIMPAVPGELTLGSRVLIKGLVGRADLNSSAGIIVADLSDGQERCGVRIGQQSIAVKRCNLFPLPCPPMLNAPADRAALHRQDLVRLHFASKSDAAALTFPEDRWWLKASADLRQDLLFKWGTLPTHPRACVNLALAPTLVFGMLAVEPRMKLNGMLKVHCIGATPDFEGCVDWSGLGELLAAAGFDVPSVVEVTHFGNEQCFVLPQGVRSWSMMQRSIDSSKAPRITVTHVDELYHAQDRPAPDVALLCHPGFDNYIELWHPTIGVLFNLNVPVLVAGHSNFAAPSNDALMHQDLGLTAFGANIIRRQMWNPFCQAYHDPTKGSLLASPGHEHDHCNLAMLSMCQGGQLRSFRDVDAFFDALDYLAVSAQGFLACEASGPMLRDTHLRLKYPRMSEAERDAVLKLLQEVTQGTLRVASTENEWVELFKQRGFLKHFRLGRGSW